LTATNKMRQRPQADLDLPRNFPKPQRFNRNQFGRLIRHQAE
jgi:hypothetical protein